MRYSYRSSARRDFIVEAVASNTDACLLWPFAVRKSSGYPAHSYSDTTGKHSVDGHRYVCELAHGKPPNGHEAAHACGNKLCVNARHLSWKTHKANMADAIDAGAVIGGGRSRERIFLSHRLYIASCGKSLLELAREFGSTPSYMGRIRRELSS